MKKYFKPVISPSQHSSIPYLNGSVINIAPANSAISFLTSEFKKEIEFPSFFTMAIFPRPQAEKSKSSF